MDRAVEEFQVITIVLSIAVDNADGDGCSMAFLKVLECIVGLWYVDGDRRCRVLIGVHDGQETRVRGMLCELDDWRRIFLTV